MPRPAPVVPLRVLRAVKRAYVTPGHPVALSTPSRVAKHFSIPLSSAKETLEEIDGYTLHREYKQPRVYNPIYVHKRREQVQADLIDIGQLSAENGGVKFLLVLIDVMTKFVWLYPIRDKSASSMVSALRRWLNEIDVAPQRLKTDQGREFRNAPVQQLLRERGVVWEAAFGTKKASVCERVNKTLQILIFKYLTENETLKYVNVLPQLVETYNKRGHRTLEGLSPREADRPANERRVQAIFTEKYGKMERLRKRKLPLKVGDIVRVKIEPRKISSDSRAYARQFKGEQFRIVRINRTLPIAMYYLKSLDDGEIIEGAFYKEELQRLKGDVYKVERVIRERRARGGGREYLVKWKDFGERHNSWVHERDIQRRF